MKERNYDFAVVGGDMRQVYLSEYLTECGCKVCQYALCKTLDEENCHQALSLKDAVLSSEVVIAPIPMSRNKKDLTHQIPAKGLELSKLLGVLQQGQRFYGGCIPEKFRNAAESDGVEVVDLMEIEELSVFNTIATAEGAIAEAISSSGENLHKSRCLILGYGRCARTLASYLEGMFCHVTVCVRKPEARSEAAVLVDEVLEFAELENVIGTFDYIFNTVPARVIDRKHLEKMRNSVLVIDIASAPGGIDFPAAMELGVPAHLCQGLPGKYAPHSSARKIGKVVLKMQKSGKQLLSLGSELQAAEDL